MAFRRSFHDSDRCRGGMLLAIVVALLALHDIKSAGAVAWRWPYVCFFEPGATKLSERCRLILKEAVDSWHREQKGREYASDNLAEGLAPPYTARFEVRGYAQEESNAEENRRLSVLRALAVADELRRLGVPDRFITPIGSGDADPEVPNAPQAPENRRSQIILR